VGVFLLIMKVKFVFLKWPVLLLTCWTLAGECKHVMASYLNCMKKVKGVNEDECRNLAKSYLACRMDQ
jgi:hypothetical protein